MKSQKKDEKKTTVSTQVKKPRFHVEKLEQRIAPWCPHINPHGKCVGWRSVRGDL
jgi:hypothetical protein